MKHSYEYLLVGGGLQNSLLALAILERNPAAHIALIERDARLGGNHTWCFHADDVPDEAGDLVAPLVEHRWLGYRVDFPGLSREIDAPYAAITSERLDRVVRARFAASPNAVLHLNATATTIAADSVVLADGRSLSAPMVVDARGPVEDPELDCGYQKFVGLELELERDHDLDRPVLMDARVPQTDGFRFVYVLPLGPRRVLVEDTYFADEPVLDSATIRSEVLDYAASRGWYPTRIVREERGVLPMPWTGAGPTLDDGPLVAGFRGGWFHPATGYSFPTALRLARAVASADPDSWRESLAPVARRQNDQMRFAYRLNRMLFRWFAPHKRAAVFERFYRLPEALIRRFYALELTAGDRARILIGRPPKGMSWRAVFNLGAAR